MLKVRTETPDPVPHICQAAHLLVVETLATQGIFLRSSTTLGLLRKVGTKSRFSYKITLTHEGLKDGSLVPLPSSHFPKEKQYQGHQTM